MTYELEDKLKNDVYAETGGDRSVIRKTVKYLIRHGWVRQPASSGSKLVELGPRIAEATRKSLTSACHLAQLEALRWLDEHPEAVPSPPAKPAITESEIAKAFGPEYVAWARMCLARIGVTVVPDPEPTNVERLRALYMEWEREGPRTLAFAEWMDIRGVTAPGSEE